MDECNNTNNRKDYTGSSPVEVVIMIQTEIQSGVVQRGSTARQILKPNKYKEI
jgi:hypothetical protein